MRSWRRAWIGCVLALLVLLGVGWGTRAVGAASDEKGNPSPRAEPLIPEVSDGVGAQKALVQRVTADRLYASWAQPGCLRFEVEAQERYYFDLAIREHHSAKCGGDLHVSPVVDRFRLYRNSDVLLWYDSAEDRYLTYQHVLDSRGLRPGQ